VAKGVREVAIKGRAGGAKSDTIGAVRNRGRQPVRARIVPAIRLGRGDVRKKRLVPNSVHCHRWKMNCSLIGRKCRPSRRGLMKMQNRARLATNPDRAAAVAVVAEGAAVQVRRRKVPAV
jgi:hypothetical protein